MVNSYFVHILAIMLLLSSSIHARTLDENALSTVAENADSIFRVEIENSHVISYQGKICSVIYTAKILDSIKGKTSRKIIQFGNVIGLASGENYLVFLRVRKEGEDDFGDSYPRCPENKAIYEIFWDGILLERGEEYWRLSSKTGISPDKYFSGKYNINEIESMIKAKK